MNLVNNKNMRTFIIITLLFLTTILLKFDFNFALTLYIYLIVIAWTPEMLKSSNLTLITKIFISIIVTIAGISIIYLVERYYSRIIFVLLIILPVQILILYLDHKKSKK